MDCLSCRRPDKLSRIKRPETRLQKTCLGYCFAGKEKVLWGRQQLHDTPEEVHFSPTSQPTHSLGCSLQIHEKHEDCNHIQPNSNVLNPPTGGHTYRVATGRKVSVRQTPFRSLRRKQRRKGKTFQLLPPTDSDRFLEFVRGNHSFPLRDLHFKFLPRHGQRLPQTQTTTRNPRTRTIGYP